MKDEFNHYIHNKEGNYFIVWLTYADTHTLEFFDPDPANKDSGVMIKIQEVYRRGDKWNEASHVIPRDRANKIWSRLRSRGYEQTNGRITAIWNNQDHETRDKNLVSALLETEWSSGIYCPFIPLEKIMQEAAVGALEEFRSINPDHALSKLYTKKVGDE